MRRAAACALALVAALALAGACGDDDERDRGSAQPQGAKLRITLGTQDFPEARLLGELWRQALAVNGYAVDLRKRIGPTEDLDQAVRAGEIDGHPAYTGHVAVDRVRRGGLRPRRRADLRPGQAALRGRAARRSARMTPYENVDAIATTNLLAQRERLRDDRRPAPARPLHARRAAGVRGSLPRARGPAAGLRAHERDVRAGDARRAVHGARRGRRRRRERVHHRPAAAGRRLHGARGSRAAVRLPERRDGRRRRQARARRGRAASCAWSTRSTAGSRAARSST